MLAEKRGVRVYMFISLLVLLVLTILGSVWLAAAAGRRAGEEEPPTSSKCEATVKLLSHTTRIE